MGDDAPNSSITTVGALVSRGRARHLAEISVSFPDVENEHLSTQTELRQNSAPIVIDGMFFFLGCCPRVLLK